MSPLVQGYGKYWNLVFIILCLSLISCIKRYEPDIKSQDAVKFVVSGQVNKGDEIQRINVSTTSPVSQSQYFPVTGCVVKILDDKGNSYIAVDKKDGNYEAVIPQTALIPGTAFKVDIVTPGGVNIVSDFDQMHDCPALDTVYYRLDSLPSSNPLVFTKGIQFYTNLDAQNYNSRYFKWEITETYEYHSTFPIEWYYDGTVHHILPPDKSKMVCWKTALIKDVFTLTTKNQAVNKYDKVPFHFVDNVSSRRLLYGYSLLVRQFAVSEAAYAYWEKIRTNSNEQGGLYTRQPMVIKGNMHNLTHPDQDVLGFFEATSVTSKRIFVQKVENLPLDSSPECSADQANILRGGLKAIPYWAYPAYLVATDYGYIVILLEPQCYDCTKSGGNTVKPAYWPY